MMNAEEMMRQAEVLAARPYPYEVMKEFDADPEIMYVAQNPDLDGCIAQGGSRDEALENLRLARIDYISFLLEHNLAVPEPSISLTPTFDFSQGSIAISNENTNAGEVRLTSSDMDVVIRQLPS